MLRTLLQALAVATFVFMYSMVLHKGYTDVSALARKHSGEQFWTALAKYFMGNLAGGGNTDR